MAPLPLHAPQSCRFHHAGCGRDFVLERNTVTNQFRAIGVVQGRPDWLVQVTPMVAAFASINVLAGLVQSGGFGSFSKHYGLAAGSLLEAEVVTADGRIRIANACTNPDLLWGLKGRGGGSYGVISKLTLRLHDLPEFFGVANFTIKAASDDSYRRLIREFVSFYREHPFNDHWGEQAHVNPGNTLVISMVS